MNHIKPNCQGLLAAVLSLCLLSGCGGPAAETPSLAPPTESVPAQPGEPVVFTRENLPRMDGSTSTAPLGVAIASVLLGESPEQVSDLIHFSRTTNSFRALMAGEADLLIVAEPNAVVFDEMREAGFQVDMEPFANDALVFVVNAGNPVESLTVEQLQGIYSGAITNWNQVGGDDQPIVPFQRNEDAGSQALMRKLVMDGAELMDPPESYVVESMMGLMEAVRAYDNSPGAIGYSVYYYAHDMEMAEGLKLISVDGVAPSKDSIRSGSYPFRNPYYVVKAAGTPEDSMTGILYRWILEEDGQRLADLQGYVPVMEVGG